MALATKCPHCNTVFRVAHDQLKLRGGIVRCGACNEVFDGNAALLEPPTPLPVTPLPDALPFDQKMAELDSRAAEVLAAGDTEPALELDAPPAESAPEPEPEPETEAEAEFDDAGSATPTPFPLPAEPAMLPAGREALFDLDLDMESEPDLEASIEPEVAAVPLSDDALIPADNLSDEELEAALEAELLAMEQTLADIQHDDDGQPVSEDAYAGIATGRTEPTWDDAALDEPQAGAGPGLDSALAAADAAIFAAENDSPTPDEERASIDTDLASFSANSETRPLRDDELEEADEEALVQLSSAGMSQSQVASAHTFLHAASAQEAPAHEDHAEPEEPGFVKRDRLRRKYGKATTIGMILGSLLLVLALFGQAVTTFRNTLAAAMPPLKPALTAACNALGCQIELPTQIDDLVIEQGELQTLSETAFSFTTLLRNQSRSAQAWPSIELTLDDANDKRILRRVFTPRDYLGADIAIDKGFAPHTEQAVKLYFELHDLKASGYHIAVFYP
jgi:predicted Zn finger-like uncharacterized protein